MKILITILLFFLPFLVWPSPLKFELAKVVFFLGWVFVLILYLLKNNFQTFKKTNLAVNKYWIFWFGVLTFSTIINQTFPFGFLAGGYRHQGVVFFGALTVFLLIGKSLKNKDLKLIFRFIVAAVLIEALIVCGQWLVIKLNLPILAYNQRPIGTIGEPNALAGFFILGLPVLVTQLKKPVIQLTAILIVIGAIVLTSSKSGALALIAEGAVFLFLWLKQFRFKKVLLFASIALIILVGIVGVWTEKDQSLFENRWLFWKLGIEAVGEKPLLGYGAEGIIQVYNQKFQRIDRSLRGLMIDRSHNLFLDIALFSGISGLVFFGAWLWQVIKKLIYKKSWPLMSLVGFLVFSFFQPIGVTHWVYLMFLISLSPSLPGLELKKVFGLKD